MLKRVLVLSFFISLIGYSQKQVDIQISYQTSVGSDNSVQIDNVLIETGFGQGSALKFHLLVFNSNCDLQDSLDLGEYNPFNANYKAYHYRQIETNDMIQLDSTLKYRLPVGSHYFLYTPVQYRKDFVTSAYAPLLTTLDSLWGTSVVDASTALLLYGIVGSPTFYDSIIVNPSDELTTMSKTICFDASISQHLNQKSIVYPNPTNGIVNMRFEKVVQRKILVFDSTGNLIREFDSQYASISFDISELHSGFYVLKIIDDQGIQTERLILE